MEDASWKISEPEQSLKEILTFREKRNFQENWNPLFE